MDLYTLAVCVYQCAHVYQCVSDLLMGVWVHVYCVHISRGMLGPHFTKSMAQISNDKKRRSRGFPRQPAAPGPCDGVVEVVVLVHLHTVCTGNSDYFDDLLACWKPSSQAVSTDLKPPSGCWPFVQLEIC